LLWGVIGTIVISSQVFYSTMLPLLDRKAITVVFANVEDILLTNTVRSQVFILHFQQCSSIPADLHELAGRTPEGVPIVRG
jgi:hypothetical protein